ncbi:MAG: hypothetical protein K0V04_02070 [Deltaproteobacteria bacterium]|nr:hypothetical protein [Deltaproteobacteria bacterium]
MHGVLGLSQLFVAAGLAIAAPAPADDPLHVEWQVDAEIDGCMSAAELETQLRERLGARLADRTRIEVAGAVSVGEGGQLRLRLQVRADDGARQRELQAPDCRALADAAVLITSLTVGGEPVQSTAPPATTATEPGVVPPVARVEPLPPVESLAEVDAPAPAASVRGLVGLGAGVAWGQVPSVGAVVDARAAAVGPRWVAQAGLRYAAPRRAFASGFVDRGVVVQAWSVGVQGGVRWPAGDRVRIPTMVGVELGAVHGQGFGIPASRRRAQLWAAPTLDTGVEVWLSRRVGLWAAARLAVPLGRPAFQIVGRGVVFRSQRVSPSGAVGVMISLG